MVRVTLEQEIMESLSFLQQKVDKTLEYLKEQPQDTEYAAKLWCDTVRDFLNYGMQKSENSAGENLFKIIKRMFLFGR